MSNIRQDIAIINERLKKIYILYRKLKGSQGGGGGIESVKVNGSTLPIVNSGVNITVPTKTSDLQNDSDFTTNNKLNNEIQNRISADNLKLDAPTTNNTNEFVILGDGSTAPKNDFGKVDKVMGVSPDSNKNVDISGIETNWTNENQQWSGLVDKSSDATYDKIMVLDADGKAGVKEDNSIPYEGANKAIDLNTQSLTHEGNLIKKEGHFEKKLLRNGTDPGSNYSKLTDVCSLSLPRDTTTIGDIVITLPITEATKWTMEVDINQSNILSSKLIITAHSKNNLSPKVSTILGHDKIHSVKFCRKDDVTLIIIKRAEQATTFSYGKVNLDTLYYSVNYTQELDVKSNYKIEFLKEEDIEGLIVSKTVLNKDFDRDSYLLDFRNFTNVPNFVQSDDVLAMLNAATFIDILTNATPEQITQIKTILGT